MSVTTEQAGEQMSMPARLRMKGKQDGGAVGSTWAFLGAARTSLKPARKKAMELWGMKEREAFGFGPTTLRPLQRSIPFLPASPSFYSFKKGAVSLINYPPNKSNYLGSLLYLILFYIHRRARTREGPVPTLYTPIALGEGFLHDFRPHLIAHPPVCAKIEFGWRKPVQA